MWNRIMNFIPTDIDIDVFCNNIESVSIDSENNVYVYLAKVKDVTEIDKDYFNELNASKSVIQSKAGLLLLKYAVKDRWGIVQDLGDIKVTDNGKPYVDDYKFSISHCGGLVCVAISKVDVGVDLECVSTLRDWHRLTRRVLTIDEQKKINITDNDMTALWTKKEAVFKLQGDKVFSPSKIEVDKFCTDSLEGIYCIDKQYVLTIASYKQTNNYLFIKKSFFNSSDKSWELI